ncbi:MULTISPECIES: hypothetical protein [unclassified Haloarcula]|nr:MULTISPECIES: hypothetical protein [unclassified Haloarcula]
MVSSTLVFVLLGKRHANPGPLCLRQERGGFGDGAIVIDHGWTGDAT